MAMIFPHAVYAEDQPYPRTILTIHCLHRGFTAGAILGMLPPLERHIFSTILRRPSPVNHTSFISRLLASAAVGSLGGIILLAFGMTARMWDCEEIEWKDRSWRLLANNTQNAEDGNSSTFIIAGALTSAFASGRGHFLAKEFTGLPRSRMIVGGAALGSVMGTIYHLLTTTPPNEEGVEEKVTAGLEGLKPSSSTT
ncbi:MAG: hypothetical protein LQ352_005265 [Teloschistes flavicans]|nr:MAG: hypothetical protein LQ352_005265 [Teloschistes flavicans]